MCNLSWEGVFNILRLFGLTQLLDWTIYTVPHWTFFLLFILHQNVFFPHLIKLSILLCKTSQCENEDLKINVYFELIFSYIHQPQLCLNTYQNDQSWSTCKSQVGWTGTNQTNSHAAGLASRASLHFRESEEWKICRFNQVEAKNDENLCFWPWSIMQVGGQVAVVFSQHTYVGSSNSFLSKIWNLNYMFLGIADVLTSIYVKNLWNLKGCKRTPGHHRSHIYSVSVTILTPNRRW